jgi:hypothetical protein
MTDKLSIWNALAKTDPAHTKAFNRAGGFKGTAIKPIWIIHMLTEQFGPVGVGWGMGKPEFHVVPCDGETLVFCTVSAWHEKPENIIWGVGGDKVQAKRSSGPFCDDEAFKKAFTDALNNAFKFLGVGADVHMGLFDDDKYVSQVRAEFADEPKTPMASDADLTLIHTLSTASGVTIQTICERANVSALPELTADAAASIIKKLNLTIKDKQKEPA